MKKVHLLIIDPQNDFCMPSGSLFVQNADKDMNKLSQFIIDNKKYIDGITISFDIHKDFHIASPVFWLDKDNNNLKPFTIIKKADILSGMYKTADEKYMEYALNYVSELEKNGRYELCIWPPHCIAGSYGACIYEPLLKAVKDYSYEKFDSVEYIFKGDNSFTEQYSVIKADAGFCSEAEKAFSKISEMIEKNDVILISGEALSHCVANTIYDISSMITNEDLGKFILLSDTVSSVGGFEEFGSRVIEYSSKRGMKIMTTKEAGELING